MDGRVERGDGALHGIHILVDQGVAADVGADLLDAAVVRDQLLGRGHVDAVDVGVTHRRRGRGHVDLVGAGLARHLHDLLRGRAAHDGVVHQQHVAALEFHGHGVELLAHALLAHRLARHDEGAADVAVLHEAFAVGLAQLLRQLHGRGPARFGNGDHHVDLGGRQAGVVDRDAVDDRIRPRQVDVFEDAGVEPGQHRALLLVQLAVDVDEDGLARRDVAHHAVAVAFQRHRFARHHPVATFGRLQLAQAQRADAVRVAEGQQAVAGDQHHHGVGALDAPVHRRHGLEHLGGRQRLVARGQLQLVGQDVDQHLGVALGVEMATVHAEQLGLERLGVGDVAVVHQHQAEGRVDVEGLGLFLAVGVARRGVAHLAQADIARQRAHVAGAEDVAHHAARLVHEELGAARGDDAGGVLAAVLQQQQCVIDQLVHW
ncbi:MAG: hypothetical protein RLZZ584_190 [Pseudomonadota bacterium]